MTVEELNVLDRFAAANGIVLQKDSATSTMKVTECHLNGAGVCQGGALFTLADLAAAGITHGEKLTVNAEIQFLYPAFLGDCLVATARILNDGKTSIVQTEIFNSDQRMIALVTSRFVTRR